MGDLSFATLSAKNGERCTKSFDHSIIDWSYADWLNAIAGEVGEAASIIKRERRGDFKMEDRHRGFAGEKVTGATWADALGDELADVVIYVDLLAQRAGIDLGEAVRRKFNATSERVRSDVTL